MKEKQMAEWILGMVDMSVASELPQAEQLEILESELVKIRETALYYYLASALEKENKEAGKLCTK